MDVIWTAEFANAGWLRPYEGELEQQVTENVFDSVLETASFEGKVYGAPFNSNTQVLWYRTDEARQAPATWDEMISEAERLELDDPGAGKPLRGLHGLGQLHDRVGRRSDPVGARRRWTCPRDRPRRRCR